jgi:hypothetical protein
MSGSTLLNVEGGEFRCVLEMRNGSIVSAHFPDWLSASAVPALFPRPALLVTVDSNPGLMASEGVPGFQGGIPMQSFWAFGSEGQSGR